MSLTATIKAFLGLGAKQPLLVFALGSIALLCGAAVACVYFSVSAPAVAEVACRIFAMLAIAMLAFAQLVLPCLHESSHGQGMTNT